MRSEDVGLVHRAGISYRETIVRADMEDASDAAYRRPYCRGIAEIASDNFDVEARQLTELTGRPHQHTDGVAVCQQLPHEVRSDESGRPRDQSRHGVATAAAAAFLRPVSCQVRSFQLSPNCRLAPRTADGS